MRILAGLALLLTSGIIHAQCAATIAAGQTATFQEPLPANSLASSICIDVPAGAERLTISASSSNPQQDIDLLMRVESPFADSAFESLGNFTVDEIIERSHYSSRSVKGVESIVISRASQQPLRAGQLQLILINFSAQPASITLSSVIGSAADFAPIQVVFNSADTANCNTAGWNDSTPATPVRGNSGTTLGQQRRNALLEAAHLLGEQLRPAAPIVVQACWDELPSGTLAQAGPRLAVVDDPSIGNQTSGLDARHTIQFSPIATHLLGIPSCQLPPDGDCDSPDIDASATFNLTVDQGSIGSRFDYGLATPTQFTFNPSFVAVAMHELMHGLGFLGITSLGSGSTPVGVQLQLFTEQRYDDSYGRFVRVVTGTSPTPPDTREFLRVSNEERAAALVSESALRFAGPITVASLENPFRFGIEPGNYARLHAPAPVVPGSSYSHLGIQHDEQLMLAAATSPAIRSVGLAGDMLRDMGLDPSPKAIPAPPLPPDGQYFDVSRDGHGIDFRRVAGFDDLYFLGFYTYDSAGNPEWFTSLGRIIDGLFVPQANEFGDSLQRFDYTPGNPGVSQVDASPGFTGIVRIDTIESRLHPVCNTNAGQRSLDGPLLLFRWTLSGQTRQWCMQQLVGPPAGASLDLSSVWFDTSDPGWGLAVQTLPGDGIAIGVYYPDAQGKGRWGIAQAGSYVANQTLTVRQVQGYCRGPECPSPTSLTLVDIGTIQVDLKPPSEGPSTLTLDVTYPGAAGGRFSRTGSVISPANSPGFRGGSAAR